MTIYLNQKIHQMNFFPKSPTRPNTKKRPGTKSDLNNRITELKKKKQNAEHKFNKLMNKICLIHHGNDDNTTESTYELDTKSISETNTRPLNEPTTYIHVTNSITRPSFHLSNIDHGPPSGTPRPLPQPSLKKNPNLRGDHPT